MSPELISRQIKKESFSVDRGKSIVDDSTVAGHSDEWWGRYLNLLNNK